jgi:hypothetical protein
VCDALPVATIRESGGLSCFMFCLDGDVLRRGKTVPRIRSNPNRAVFQLLLVSWFSVPLQAE